MRRRTCIKPEQVYKPEGLQLLISVNEPSKTPGEWAGSEKQHSCIQEGFFPGKLPAFFEVLVY